MILRRRNSSQINKYISRIQKESDDIIKEVMALSYYMRGGLQYDAGFYVTVPERRLMTEFLQDHLAKECKKPHPNY